MTGFRSESRATLRQALALEGGFRAKDMAELRGVTEKSAMKQLLRLTDAGIFRRVEIAPRRYAFEFIDRRAANEILNPPVVKVKRVYPCSFVFNLGAI